MKRSGRAGGDLGGKKTPRRLPAIRLELCFSSMRQMWSVLVRPAGGGTEQEQPEHSWTRYELPLIRDGSLNLWSWS